MKKSMVSLILASFLALVAVLPQQGYALTDKEIDDRLKKIEMQAQEAAKKQQEAEKQKQDIARQKAQETKNMQELWKQIEEQGARLAELDKQIAAANASLRETNKQLQEAEHRVASRDQLLKSRVRLMYTNGFVSYMEVLLESTSFSDFLDRYHALKSIVSQDKDILEANKKDRDAIAQKKRQIEEQLAHVQSLYAQAEQIKNSLMAREKDKEVLIASLSKQEKELEEFSEDQEEYLKQLAREKAKLWAEKNKNKTQTVYSGGKLHWPLPGRYAISSGFGYRVDPINKTDANHKGIDIPAPAGTAIEAAEAGTVIVAQYVNGYGNTVVIDHGGGLQTWYGHIRNNGIKVEEGQQVKRGQKIAEVGSTGRSTGNHLHFEVRKNEVPVDPMPYVK